MYNDGLSPAQAQKRISAAVLPPQANKDTIEQKGLHGVGLDIVTNNKMVRVLWSS